MSACPDLPFLTVAIATTGPRLAQLTLPPPQPELTYVITCQMAGDLLETPGLEPFADRADVVVCAVAGRGLSRNRNAGLAATRTPFVLFSDDDIALAPVGLVALTEALLAAPDCAFALGWRAEAAAAAGAQPEAPPRPASRLNTGRICVPEILCRVSALTGAGITFDTGFGVGAPHPVGEDYIFVTDLLRAGLRGQHWPIVTGAHPHASSGDIWDDPRLVTARQAVLGRVFGRWAPLARLAYAVRHRHHLGSLSAAAAFVLRPPPAPDASGG